jgi:hypothetical protein
MTRLGVFGVIATTVFLLSGCQQDSIPSEINVEATVESVEDDAFENTASLFNLEIGTCLNDANTPLSADLTEVPTVSCAEPHDSELFAIVSVEDGSYPGVDDLVKAGQTKCQAVFADFVGIDFRSSTLDFHFYYPTPSSWAQDDRSIFCLVGDPGFQVVGTLQGAKR